MLISFYVPASAGLEKPAMAIFNAPEVPSTLSGFIILGGVGNSNITNKVNSLSGKPNFFRIYIRPFHQKRAHHAQEITLRTRCTPLYIYYAIFSYLIYLYSIVQ